MSFESDWRRACRPEPADGPLVREIKTLLAEPLAALGGELLDFPSKSEDCIPLRMRLSTAGEIRALLRIGEARGYRSLGGLAPRIKEAVMETLDEVIEPTVKLHMTDTHITLDQKTAQALYALAWEKFEEALAKANVAYNEGEWSNPHERAKELLRCSQDLKQAIEVVFELTPMPDDEIED